MAWEIARLQRQEFGPPQIVLRVRGWIRRLLGRSITHTASGAAHVSAGGTVRARGRVGTAPDAALEDRVHALERNFESLDREFVQTTREFEQNFRAVEQQQNELRQHFERQQQERDQERRESLRWTIKSQTIGTALFVLGAVLSVLGNAVTC